MVGHTGSLEATIVSMEALDLCIGRILKTADKLGTTVLFTADHGNADECLEKDKKTGGFAIDKETGLPKAKTSHTLNPVPFIFYDNNGRDKYDVIEGSYGLSNIAATVVNLLGFEAPEKWDASMIKVKD
jgi:2,3-bisphosphoglycerate-independent phosphoglycerate mutase